MAGLGAHLPSLWSVLLVTTCHVQRPLCQASACYLLLGHGPLPQATETLLWFELRFPPNLTPVFLPFPSAPAGEALRFPCRLPLHITTEEESLGSWQGITGAAGG